MIARLAAGRAGLRCVRYCSRWDACARLRVRPQLVGHGLPLAGPWPWGLRPRFSSRCSSSAQVVLHCASGPRICSSAASCSSKDDSSAFSASMLRRCAGCPRRSTSAGQPTGWPAAELRPRQRNTLALSGQVPQHLGYRAELAGECLDHGGNHSGRAPLVISHWSHSLPEAATSPPTVRSFPVRRVMLAAVRAAAKCW